MIIEIYKNIRQGGSNSAAYQEIEKKIDDHISEQNPHNISQALSQYATTAQLEQALNLIPQPDLSQYVMKTAVATASQLGLVKSSNAAGRISVNADGTMTAPATIQVYRHTVWMRKYQQRFNISWFWDDTNPVNPAANGPAVVAAMFAAIGNKIIPVSGVYCSNAGMEFAVKLNAVSSTQLNLNTAFPINNNVANGLQTFGYLMNTSSEISAANADIDITTFVIGNFNFLYIYITIGDQI